MSDPDHSAAELNAAELTTLQTPAGSAAGGAESGGAPAAGAAAHPAVAGMEMLANDVQKAIQFIEKHGPMIEKLAAIGGEAAAGLLPGGGELAVLLQLARVFL